MCSVHRPDLVSSTILLPRRKTGYYPSYFAWNHRICGACHDPCPTCSRCPSCCAEDRDLAGKHRNRGAICRRALTAVYRKNISGACTSCVLYIYQLMPQHPCEQSIETYLCRGMDIIGALRFISIIGPANCHATGKPRDCPELHRQKAQNAMRFQTLKLIVAGDDFRCFEVPLDTRYYELCMYLHSKALIPGKYFSPRCVED